MLGSGSLRFKPGLVHLFRASDIGCPLPLSSHLFAGLPLFGCERWDGLGTHGIMSGWEK